MNALGEIELEQNIQGIFKRSIEFFEALLSK